MHLSRIRCYWAGQMETIQKQVHIPIFTLNMNFHRLYRSLIYVYKQYHP